MKKYGFGIIAIVIVILVLLGFVGKSGIMVTKTLQEEDCEASYSYYIIEPFLAMQLPTYESIASAGKHNAHIDIIKCLCGKPKSAEVEGLILRYANKIWEGKIKEVPEACSLEKIFVH